MIELLVSFTVFSVLMVLLLGAVTPVSRAWSEGERRVETHQRARGALELLARELTPAVVDTRMQFVVLPGEELSQAGASGVAPESPALLWMAPLGQNGQLRCVGYYLYRDQDRGFFRLKRIFIRPHPPDDPDRPNPYFPRLVNHADTRDLSMRTSPVSANWFLDRWDESAFAEEDLSNNRAVVSTVADGVIGFWVQCYDLLGEPIPWLSKAMYHPRSPLIYNSAAYFQMATTSPFDSGRTTVFLAKTPQAMKANRVPAEMEFSLVVVDESVSLRGTRVPTMQNLMDGKGALDMDASVEAFMKELEKAGIDRAEVFTTRVKLVNGS
ncbi:MAG: hypothetical protein KDN19_09695 [Verrucomicrobiae bacterium]|nr:hypothetical protein [Verrucomicrobiae bacterium]